jgi:DNA replication and repair protein RecF
MHLRSLELEEFRSYRRLDLNLIPAGLRLAGANASGKSTLLEAIAVLATTRSPRSSAERELIHWDSGTDLGVPPYARVRGVVVASAGTTEVEIALQADGEGAAGRQVRKQIRVNGRPVRAMDAVGMLKAVLFSPEDVGLVSGSPSGRRRYLDVTISQLDGRYLRSLSRYGKILAQRNGLLRTLARDRVNPGSPAARAQLAFWDEELVAVGSAIVAHRARTVARLAELARDRSRLLTDSGELAVTYRPSVPVPSARAGSTGDRLEDLQALIARDFVGLLDDARPEEVRRGVSVLGPHRDDLGLAVGPVDLATYGSRGQQRLAVVALKLAEADLMAEAAGEPPVVLLDDVLSELDTAHGGLLLETIAALGSQTIVTATDPRLLDVGVLGDLPRSLVHDGTVAGDPV